VAKRSAIPLTVDFSPHDSRVLDAPIICNYPFLMHHPAESSDIRE
jgi:hypothetical protein